MKILNTIKYVQHYRLINYICIYIDKFIKQINVSSFIHVYFKLILWLYEALIDFKI